MVFVCCSSKLCISKDRRTCSSIGTGSLAGWLMASMRPFPHSFSQCACSPPRHPSPMASPQTCLPWDGDVHLHRLGCQHPDCPQHEPLHLDSARLRVGEHSRLVLLRDGLRLAIHGELLHDICRSTGSVSGLLDGDAAGGRVLQPPLLLPCRVPEDAVPPGPHVIQEIKHFKQDEKDQNMWKRERSKSREKTKIGFTASVNAKIRTIFLTTTYAYMLQFACSCFVLRK